MTKTDSPSPAGRDAATISVRNASKFFGDVVSVNDVSFDVSPGVTGLLGPNGAGKTTLLRMISGLAAPSQGEARVLGEPVRNNPAIYSRIGVMPEHEGVYGFMSGRDFVALNARLHGLPDICVACDRAIDRVNLRDAQDRPLGTYSRGMRQRMRMAAAIVHDPEVLLLDEPLSGTDPRQRLQFIALVRRLAEAGRTILISSHILEEVEAMADRILLMVNGRLAAAGDYRAIREQLNERPYRVAIAASDPRAMARGLIDMPEVESVAIDDDGTITVLSRNVRALQRAVPRIAQRHNVRITRLDPVDDTLESVFSYIAHGQGMAK